jgi:septum formation inhibitor-activating ATPase MinD
MLDRKLQGIRTDPKQPKTTIITYADDVTILITTPDEIPSTQDALLCYQSASGATINFTKSEAIAVGGWDKNIDIMGIVYHESIKILGIQFQPQTDVTPKNNWTPVIRNIRAQASEAYNRELSMSQRIYTHTYLMPKAWYVAQVLPLPKIHERQLKTTMNWYV